MSRRRIAATHATGFCRYPVGPLFSVNEGMPVDLALEHASCLLDCVNSLAVTIGDGNAHGSEIYAVQYLAEMAKALVDAAGDGAYDAGAGQ